jgi:transcriptional regulator with XRE-family HTH domain
MDKSFANALRETRLESYLTQAEFSRRAGVPLGTYKNWELGRQLPSPSSWEKLHNYIKTLRNISLKYSIQEIYIKDKTNGKK